MLNPGSNILGHTSGSLAEKSHDANVRNDANRGSKTGSSFLGSACGETARQPRLEGDNRFNIQRLECKRDVDT